MNRLLRYALLASVLLAETCLAVPAPLQFRQPVFLAHNSSSLALKRSVSQDPSCPSGFLCNQSTCPEDAICGEGESCVNFEGTLGCIPTGMPFCALNPSTFQAVGCHQGGVCCHGNCYIQDTVCCNNDAVQCSVGELCNACPQGSTCGSSQCSGSPASLPPSTPPTSPSTKPVTVSKPTSTLVATLPPPKTSTRQPSSTVVATLPPPKTTTQSANPTILPSSGTFKDLGCFEDSTTSRMLTNGSTTDSSGMTVEKCVDLAHGYQYAGLEFSSECFWGNFPSYSTTESSGDCNMPCSGNSAEICGGGNRILVYQDQSWVLLTDPEYAAALRELQTALTQLETLIKQWVQELQTYRDAIKAAAKTRKRQDGGTATLSQQSQQLSITKQEVMAAIKGQDIELKIIKLEFQLVIKVNQQQKTAESAVNDVNNLENAITQAADTISEGDDIPELTEGTIPTAGDVAVVEDVLSSVTDIASKVGVPAIAGVIATGFFATLGTLIGIFEGGSGTGTLPPPTTTAKTSSTTSKTSSSTTSSATGSATPYVLCTKPGTSQVDFQNLINSVGNPIQGEVIGYKGMPFQIYSAPLNDTMVDKAFGNPIVFSIELNGNSQPVEDFSKILLPNAKRDDDIQVAASHRPSTLVGRAPAPGTLLFKENGPINLAMLSDPFAQAQPLSPPDYVFRQPQLSQTWVYILDTGVQSTHLEFSGNAPTIRSNPPLSDIDTHGHGTSMASVVTGQYGGSFTDVNVVSVKVGNGTFKYSDVLRGWAIVVNDVRSRGRQGHAVINLSIVYNTRDLCAVRHSNDCVRDSAFIPMLSDAFDNGIVVVTLAGNDGATGGHVEDFVPQAHAAAPYFPDKLIVVGSVNPAGALSPFNSLDPNGVITCFLNGEDVVAAHIAGWYAMANGTSSSSAMTAGFVAELLEHPTYGTHLRAGGNDAVATAAKRLVKQLAVPNPTSGLLIVNSRELGFARGQICQQSPVTPAITPRDLEAEQQAPAPGKLTKRDVNNYQIQQINLPAC